MSMKKKLGSKLSEGVRQVQSQREPLPTLTPATAMPVSTPAANPMPASVTVKPTTPPAATQAERDSNKLHPRRVWPD